MRFIFLPIIVALASGGALAQEAEVTSPLASNDLWIRQKACKGVGDLAATIMKERQKEVPMSEMIGRLQAASGMGLYEGTGIDDNLLVAMITAAYKRQAFSSPDRQADMVAEFRNEIELLCFEGELATSP